MTSVEIADHSSRLRQAWVASLVGAAAVAGQRSYLVLRKMLGIEPGAILALGDPLQGNELRIEVNNATSSARTDPEFGRRIAVDSISMVVIAVEVEIRERARHDPKLQELRRDSLELQTLKHLRNAASHGNRFRFYDGEPKAPASFAGRVLSRSLEGKAAIGFEALFPVGVVFKLLETVETQLRSLSH